MKGLNKNDVFYNNNGRIETPATTRWHSGRHQQRTGHLLPRSLQARGNRAHGTAHRNMDGVDTTLKARGRHDPAYCPRRAHRGSHGSRDPARFLLD